MFAAPAAVLAPTVTLASLLDREERRELLRCRRARQRFSTNVAPDGLRSLAGLSDGVSVETLLDRVVRGGGQMQLRLSGGGCGAAPPGPAPPEPVVSAVFKRYARSGQGVEIVNAQHLSAELGASLSRIGVELATPFTSQYCSLFVVAAGERVPLVFVGEEALFIVLRGAVRFGSASEPSASEGPPDLGRGAFAYFPLDERTEVVAGEESLVLAYRFAPTTPGDFLVGLLESRLRAHAGLSAESLLGAFGDDTRVRTEALQALADATVALRDELSRLSPADALQGPVTGRPAAGGRNARPVPQARPRGVTLASDDLYDLWNSDTSFELRTDDIVVVTYPRSGTTWMQMILFQLLTDGDLEKITHIYEFSPFIVHELRSLGTTRMDAMRAPRVLKSHRVAAKIYRPDRAKFIYVARNGLDVAVSQYFHFVDQERLKVGLETHFDRFMAGQTGQLVPFGSWFGHVAAWWDLRQNPNVLFLKYEEMIAKPADAIQAVAAFCGLEPSAETLARTLARSAFSFMRAHHDKFEHSRGSEWLRRQEKRHGFIREGAVGQGKSILGQAHVEAFLKAYESQLSHLPLDLRGIRD